MKKLIGTVAVAALLATAAFAELNIGAGYNHGIWNLFFLEKEGDADAKISMEVGAPWLHWNNGVRTGVSFSGAGENIGFVLDIKGDGGNIAVNDNTYVWAKPWEWLEIRAGSWYGDALKSAQSYGIRGSRRLGLGHHETTTFARISSDGNYDAPIAGALLAITPIEGLFIGAGFDIDNGYGSTKSYEYADEKVTEKNETNPKRKIEDVFKDSQYAVGYTIADLLAIKAQYIGGATAGIFGIGDSSDDLKGTINAGVDLLMLEGMKIGIGAFIPLEEDSRMSFAATFDGGFDELSVNAYVGAEIARAKVDYHGIEAGVGLGYDLGNGIGLNGDLRYRIDLPTSDNKVNGDKVDATNEVTVGFFVSKGMSNGAIALGVEGDFKFGGEKYIGVAVPLSIQCGF